MNSSQSINECEVNNQSVGQGRNDSRFCPHLHIGYEGGKDNLDECVESDDSCKTQVNLNFSEK